jgi:hypothetical protein
MATTIDALTLADISSDGSGTDEDVEQFKAACRDYQRVSGCTDREAIEAIWNDGDFQQCLFWGEANYAKAFLDRIAEPLHGKP